MNNQQQNKATTDSEVQPLERPGVLRPHLLPATPWGGAPVLASRNDLRLVHSLTLLGTG